ncbi:GntR family transcriptional regulator [Alkalicoccus urumqiensis]|uniref:Phosphonate metabolism transcriptional regulator PhnF n=1 Tax=Alkalicoccus urumqiensis TaxID=1548213 RepID=A0A2P6MLR6_ALKUR|nr:GntR family transcriptional regulator [Alkalicoccus urumqiensis]PRO67198.1 phosphonate metabolism transcriptional regulator PhnF [Alkalicoccus urumqiensis]
MIDKHSSIPIYYQLAEQIKGRIHRGELAPGDVLPSERDFAEQYDISRMTVRQAITSLVNEGLLYRRKGTGTFVSEPKIEQAVGGLTSFTEDMRSRGLEPASRMLHFGEVPAPGDVALILGIAEGDNVIEMRRIRLADNVPMALETTWLHPSVVHGLTEKEAESSLYSYLEETLGLIIGRAEQALEASLVMPEEADILGVEKGAPVLSIERRTYLADDRPLEVVRSKYRADRYRFMMDLQRAK